MTTTPDDCDGKDLAACRRRFTQPMSNTSNFPDFRVLAQELLQHARQTQALLIGEGLWDVDDDEGLFDRADKALATPPPELSEAEALAEWLYKRGQGMDLGTRDWYFRTSVVLQELAAVNAALATPPPEPPTDEEAQKLFDKVRTPIYGNFRGKEIIVGHEPVRPGDFARAVLERWGNG